MRKLAAVLLFATLVSASIASASPPGNNDRVLILGDSITYDGRWIEFVEAFLRAKEPEFDATFFNLGLPSETVSGLSEPGHAGGDFPRPELRERLDRVLARIKPNLIIACYGMNDGIYHPFDDDRFEAFKKGLIELHDKAEGVHAKILHLAPPPFDPVPIKANTLPAGLAEYPRPFEGYDEVLTRYSEWLTSREKEGWEVLDIHAPLKLHLENKRRADPSFRLADDGIHLNEAGHWLIARELLKHWKIPVPDESSEAALRGVPHGLELLRLVQERQRMLKDAWLTAIGHKRPGMAKGRPLDEVRAELEMSEKVIRALQTNP